MRVSHVLRKPLIGSVAQNVLDHGCGAMNIDGTRIRADGETVRTNSRSPEASAKVNRPIYGEYGPLVTHQSEGQKLGRWPANLILASGGVARDIDEQSGVSKSSGGHIYGGGHGLAGDWVAGDPGFGDIGGASRYYKQVRSTKMAEAVIPQDLLDYLYALIAPTHLDDCQVLYVPDFAQVVWDELADASLHGMIAVTPPGGDLMPWKDHIWRVLKPGAHLLLIAPEDQPTGHTGACIMEDQGFEVRDAILIAQEAGHLHYVPKPAQRERHAGCEHIKIRKLELLQAKEEDDDPDMAEVADSDLDSEEGWDEEPAEVEHPIDGKNMHKGNVHPTVKPKDLLVRLLADVPQGTVVLDPFLGSGSMGLACLETGHDYIGIEMEEDYLEIADARVRHWDRVKAGWNGATIESEAPSHEVSEKEYSLDDFFNL